MRNVSKFETSFFEGVLHFSLSCLGPNRIVVMSFPIEMYFGDKIHGDWVSPECFPVICCDSSVRKAPPFFADSRIGQGSIKAQ